MQIQNIGYQNKTYATQFKGTYEQELLTPIKNTKIGKGLTQLDILAFKSYVMGKKFAMGVTAKEVKELSKLEGNEFIVNAYKTIADKVGISQETRPKIIFGKTVGKMGYVPMFNIITVDPKNLQKNTKPEIFGLLRHEIQHFKQNAMVLCHEELGEKAITNSIEKYRQAEKNSVSYVLSLPDETIKEIIKLTPNPEQMEKYVNLGKSGQMDKVNEMIDQFAEKYKQDLTSLREKLIVENGLIKKDSKISSKVEGYFDDLINGGYYNSENGIDWKKYFESQIEHEAMFSQTQAQIEFSQEPCGLKYLKGSTLSAIKEKRY
mgnify:CR=1 FL=1